MQFTLLVLLMYSCSFEVLQFGGAIPPPSCGGQPSRHWGGDYKGGVRYHVRITSASHLYHVRITSVPHPYHIHMTSVSHPHHIHITSVSHRILSVLHPYHIRITSVSHPYHIRITSASHPHHIRITSIYYPYHIRITSASHPYHICVTSASRPYRIRTISVSRSELELALVPKSKDACPRLSQKSVTLIPTCPTQQGCVCWCMCIFSLLGVVAAVRMIVLRCNALPLVLACPEAG